MSLFERLRTAEQEGREAARQGFSWARTNLEETQSRIRRKMRIHPRTAKSSFSLGPIQAGAGTTQAEEAEPIISINGEDVLPEDVGSHGDLEIAEPKTDDHNGQAA